MWFGAAVLPGAPQADRTLDVIVNDQSSLALSGVLLELRGGEGSPVTAYTGADGHAVLSGLRPGRYRLAASFGGYEKLEEAIDLSGPEETVKAFVVMAPSAARTSVEVTSEGSAVEQGSSTATTISKELAKNLPDRPATVADTLPLVPGVAREPGGALIISDSPEHRAALIVNSADVTDPATGQFGLTVPIDSVLAIDVYQTPFQAEYGRFTACWCRWLRGAAEINGSGNSTIPFPSSGFEAGSFADCVPPPRGSISKVL